MRPFRRVPAGDAFSDFLNIFRSEQPHKTKFMVLSLLMTASLFTFFMVSESGFVIEPKPPEIVYVDSLPENRTDEEIIARARVKGEEAEARRAQAERIARERRESYRRIADRFGIEYEK